MKVSYPGISSKDLFDNSVVWINIIVLVDVTNLLQQASREIGFFVRF